MFKYYSDFLYVVPGFYSTNGEVNVLTVPDLEADLEEIAGSVYVYNDIINQTANCNDAIPIGTHTCAGWKIDTKHVC